MSERRKRLKPPLSLLIFGTAFLLLPFINYFSMSAQTGIQAQYFKMILSKLNYFEVFLLFASFPVGVGLLSVKRWGWWSFFIYSFCLLGYNFYELILFKDAFNLGVLARTLVGVSLVIFFCRKDISAPYFKMYPRGWRFQKRKPVVVDVILDNETYQTKDISSSGLYLETKDLSLELNSGVELVLKLKDKNLNLKAGAVRIDSNGVGLAFRGITKAQEQEIEKLIVST